MYISTWNINLTLLPPSLPPLAFGSYSDSYRRRRSRSACSHGYSSYDYGDEEFHSLPTGLSQRMLSLNLDSHHIPKPQMRPRSILHSNSVPVMTASGSKVHRRLSLGGSKSESWPGCNETDEGRRIPLSHPLLIPSNFEDIKTKNPT